MVGSNNALFKAKASSPAATGQPETNPISSATKLAEDLAKNETVKKKASMFGESVGKNLAMVGAGAVARATVGRVPFVGPVLSMTASQMIRSELNDVNFRDALIKSDEDKRAAVIREGGEAPKPLSEEEIQRMVDEQVQRRLEAMARSEGAVVDGARAMEPPPSYQNSLRSTDPVLESGDDDMFKSTTNQGMEDSAMFHSAIGDIDRVRAIAGEERFL